MTAAIKHKAAEGIIYAVLCPAIVYSMLFLTYVNTLLIILLAIYWLVFTKKEFDISSRKTRLMLLFISLYIAGMLGMIYTDNTKAGMATLKTQSAILIFPLIFGTISFITPVFLNRILFHTLIATTLASVAGLLYGSYNYFQTGDIEMLTGKNILFFHAFRPVLMGLFCLLSIVIAFEKIRASQPKKKLLLSAIILLMTLMIFLLSIRLTIVCWLLVIVYFCITAIKKTRHKMLLAAVAVVAVVASAFTIPTVKKQWSEFFDSSSRATIVLDKDSSLEKSWGGKALRVAIWKCSADILKDHWLTGVGTGDVQDHLQQAYENRKFYFASRYNRYNAHNEYLQVTLANGLPGLLVLLACIFYPLLQYRKMFTGNIYLLLLIIFAIICISESILEVNKGIVWYSFFNSIFAFGYLKSDNS